MKHVLVTGASGFIGAALVEALAARGDRVTALDMVIGSKAQALADRYDGVSVALSEITEWPSLFESMQADPPDGIVHCAAVVGVLASAQAPYRTFEVNVNGSLNVFEAARLLGVRRIIHISSEETYGDFTAPIIDETHPQNPLMAYGISKLAVEHLGRSYGAHYGLEVVNMRVCWAYGPGLPRARVPKNFVDAAALGTACHLEHGAGMAVDHTHIDDVVQGLVLALDKDVHPFDAYNLGTGYAAPLSEIVDIVKDLVPGADISVGPGEYVHGAGEHSVSAVRKGALDINRARETLGFKPRYPIREGLAAYVEAVKAGRG